MNAIWPIDWPAGTDTGSEAHKALAESLAAGTMRLLTLNRVGGAPVTVMPFSRACTHPRFGSMRALAPYEVYLGCLCAAGCGCPGDAGVVLDGPVGRIDEVKVDGQVLDPAAYAVEDGNRLVRTDGGVWPPCAGAGFTVTYLNAYPVDAVGRHAAGVLAVEYLKAVTGAKGCKLPSQVTSVTRQGLSFEMNTGMFPEGTTGINEVDAYLMQWNPHGLRTAPRVYSPDLKRSRPKVRWF